MAKYLITIRSSAPLAALSDKPAPADYLLDHVVEAEPETDDGLAHWSIELQLAGSLADWVKAPAYAAFWAYLHEVTRALELRPRAALRIYSRFDPHSVSVALAYLGDHELKRAAEQVRQRLEATIEPKSRKMKADVSLTF